MGIVISDILAVLPGGDTKVCSVYIDGGVIAGIDSPPAGFTAQKRISGSGRLLIPGLINAHTHAYMTVFRNCADDLSFSDWLFGRIQPLEDRLTGEMAYHTSLLGCLEMIASGVTSFLDMHMFPDSTARAVSESGMRAVLSRGLVGGKEEAEGPDFRLDQAEREMERWKNCPRLSFMLGPHAPYSCSPEYQRRVAREAERLGVGIHMHLAESRGEVENIRKEFGVTPIELADRAGLLNEKTVAAHCVRVTGGDIALLAKRGVSVAANTVSNLKLGNGVAPVPEMLKAGVNVCIGTDGASSNNAMSVLREMSFMSLIHKGISGDMQAVTARDTLKMATENGAAALKMPGVTGRIEPGAAADLAVIDLDRLNMRPVNDPVAALCYSANGSETETVICGGRVIYDRGVFPGIDREEVVSDVENICKKLGMR